MYWRRSVKEIDMESNYYILHHFPNIMDNALCMCVHFFPKRYSIIFTAMRYI